MNLMTSTHSDLVPTTGEPDNGEAAIIAVIHSETKAFMDADFEAWAACWVQDERAKNVFVSSIGRSVISGWQEIAAQMRHALVEEGGCGMARFHQENFQINMHKEIAWVAFEQTAEDKDGGTWKSFETRILERVEGRWKLVYILFMEQHYDRIAKDALCVDEKGQIVWASPETLDTLKRHPHLTVSAGRIRARKGSWDKALQSSIAQSGQYHDFFELWRFTQETGGPFHYPVVLGESDEGGVVVVHISVRDSSTYLLFGGDGSLDRRLAVAQAVFGLSDGQLRVARNIAYGVGLKEAAEVLGVSINTVRTHLTRLYEKTGVSSQTALVRLLLSVG